MTENKTALSAVGALFLLVVMWSYNWVVLKAVQPYIGPLEFAALRCILGALLLLVLLPLTGRSLAPPPWRPVVLIGALQAGGMTGFSQLALVAGGAGKTAVIVYTMPFWVIVLAALFLNEKPRRAHYVAILLAAVGLALVVQPWHLGGTLGSSLLALASGITWAAGIVAAKRLFQHQPVDLLSLTTWQMVVGAVVLSVLALLFHEKPIIWSSYAIGALAYNAILATALGWTLWLFILRALPAGVAGLSTLLIPVASVLWAWWLLGERPDAAEATGICLIVLALVLISGPQALLKTVQQHWKKRRP